MARRLLIVRNMPEMPEELLFFLKLKPAPVGQYPELKVSDDQLPVFTRWVVDAKVIIRGLYDEITKMAEHLNEKGVLGKLEIPDGSDSEYYCNLLTAHIELSSFLNDARHVLMTWYES
ncbi:MAG: hypothetical protein PHW31_00205 [Candidatus Pacebacteria bacterium]|nr:hypothetical protein [Candidatus Paceibacterota bacterium]